MPDPTKFKDRNSFMDACMSDTKREGLKPKQRLGKCLGMWRNAKGGPEPKKGGK